MSKAQNWKTVEGERGWLKARTLATVVAGITACTAGTLGVWAQLHHIVGTPPRAPWGVRQLTHPATLWIRLLLLGFGHYYVLL